MTRTRLFHLGASAFMALIIASASAQTVDTKPEAKQEVIDSVTHLIDTVAYVPGVDFKKWNDYLQAAKPKLDAAKTDDDFQAAMNTALFEFGESHIALLTPKQANQRTSGATVGIGISSQITPDGLMVVRVIKDAPADKAGLVPGDLVVKVEGQKVDGIKGIPGLEGTAVTITVKHANGATQDYTITRHKFSTIRKEELTWLTPDTAKLNIYTFDLSYDAKNVESLMAQAEDAKNLIIDLRDNGGGSVPNLLHLLGLLMNPEQPIGTFIDRGTVKAYEAVTGKDASDLDAVASWSDFKIRPTKNKRLAPYRGHLFVFVNGLSGSASEMAAAALHDLAGAKIVGTKSAGAVLVSMIRPVADGFNLQIPVMDYVTIRGKRLEGNGVTPDIVAQDPIIRLPNTKDACADAVLALLSTGTATGAKTGG